jgi:hypothetical protein
MGELLWVPLIEGHIVGEGISRVSKRLRLPRLLVEVTEFRVIGVTKLPGLVPGAEKHVSLISVSSSAELSSSVAS